MNADKIKIYQYGELVLERFGSYSVDLSRKITVYNSSGKETDTVEGKGLAIVKHIDGVE